MSWSYLYSGKPAQAELPSNWRALVPTGSIAALETPSDKPAASSASTLSPAAPQTPNGPSPEAQPAPTPPATTQPVNTQPADAPATPQKIDTPDSSEAPASVFDQLLNGEEIVLPAFDSASTTKVCTGPIGRKLGSLTIQ